MEKHKTYGKPYGNIWNYFLGNLFPTSKEILVVMSPYPNGTIEDIGKENLFTCPPPRLMARVPCCSLGL
jgi:hypothetical protein